MRGEKVLYREELKSLLTKIQMRKEYVSSQLIKVPEGTLGLENRRGTSTFVLSQNRDGVRSRKSLLKKPDLVGAILRNMLTQRELAVLEHDCKVLESALRSYKAYDPARAILELQMKYRKSPIDLSALLPGVSAADEWASAAFDQASFLPETKRHITRSGVRVRSKSELLIAEKLYEYKLPFRYEQVLYVCDTPYAPDFTIRRADGKLFYWEHFGLLGSKEYFERQVNKIRQYVSVGITPWDNLIITFEDEAGDLDVRSVESEIRNRLLI